MAAGKPSKKAAAKPTAPASQKVAATSKAKQQKPEKDEVVSEEEVVVPKQKVPAASENKWRKLAMAVKGGKPSKKAVQVESDESEAEEESEEELPPPTKKGKPTASVAKKPSKIEDADEEEVDEKRKSSGKKAVVQTSTKARKPVVEESESEDEEEEEMDEDEDEMDEDEDGDQVNTTWMDSDEEEEEDDDEFGGITTKKQLAKRKMHENEEDEDDEDEVRLTHMGEEVEDDEEGLSEEEVEEGDENMEDEEGEAEEEEEEDEDEASLTPAELAVRVKETAAALSDFKAYRKRTKSQVSRSQLVTRLSKDCASYYGYIPDLIDLFLTLFGPTEMVEFLEANETPRPTCIRANTLKTTRRELAKALTARGIGLEPVADWTNVGLKIFESQIPVGATPEYLAGQYMIQSPSSLAPVMALDPRPGEKVLDMCAAPGGKTTHIAQLMRNEGLLVANDAKLPRMDALVANLARMGVKIAASVHQDGRDFPKVLGGFDRILLDAPCSGLGVISHDPSVKQSRTLQDIQATANLQRELILAAIDSCDHKSKEGGIVVYSTCSISVQENEQIVQYALEKRDVVLVECGFDFGKPGLTRWQGKLFHPNMKLCKRLYPHTHNMDGFFIAKLKKRSNAILENGKPIPKKKVGETEVTQKSEAKGKPKADKKASRSSEEEADDIDSVSSEEAKNRKKQSEIAKRKAEKMKRKFGGENQMQGKGKKRPSFGGGKPQKKHKA